MAKKLCLWIKKKDGGATWNGKKSQGMEYVKKSNLNDCSFFLLITMQSRFNIRYSSKTSYKARGEVFKIL